MRQVRYSVAASLDGFIAGLDGEYDWIPEEPELDFQAFFQQIDTVLMGRKSFEVAQQGPGLDFLPEGPVFVFSKTMQAGKRSGHTVVVGDAAEFVRGLKELEGRDIWLFGGGSLFGSLLTAGVVDLVEVAIVPVLLGAGVPLLPTPQKARLELVRTETFPSGIVLNRYQVQNPS
jgi:dihydrofolate reductase